MTLLRNTFYEDNNIINLDDINISQNDLEDNAYILGGYGLLLKWYKKDIEQLNNLEGSGLLEASNVNIKMEAINISNGISEINLPFDEQGFTTNNVGMVTELNVLDNEAALFDIILSNTQEDQQFTLQMTIEYNINSTESVDADDPMYWFINNDYTFTRVINIPVFISAS